jgi:hypothetical protein
MVRVLKKKCVLKFEVFDLNEAYVDIFNAKWLLSSRIFMKSRKIHKSTVFYERNTFWFDFLHIKLFQMLKL